MRKLMIVLSFIAGAAALGSVWAGTPLLLCGGEKSGDEFIAVEVMPVLVYEEQLEYPAEARAAGIEGKTVITLRVGTDGNASGVRVKESSGSDLLDKAAKAAAEKYRFRPAVQDGKLVSVWVCFTVDFVLNAEKADERSPMVIKAIQTEPELIRQVQPTYPPEAVAAKIEGKVLIYLFVNADGKVTQSKVAKSSGNKLLDDAALEAGRKYEFKPARQGDRPVAVWVYMPVVFALQ